MPLFGGVRELSLASDGWPVPLLLHWASVAIGCLLTDLRFHYTWSSIYLHHEAIAEFFTAFHHICDYQQPYRYFVCGGRTELTSAAQYEDALETAFIKPSRELFLVKSFRKTPFFKCRMLSCVSLAGASPLHSRQAFPRSLCPISGRFSSHWL
jgi:hypothetical protein